MDANWRKRKRLPMTPERERCILADLKVREVTRDSIAAICQKYQVCKDTVYKLQKKHNANLQTQEGYALEVGSLEYQRSLSNDFFKKIELMVKNITEEKVSELTADKTIYSMGDLVRSARLLSGQSTENKSLHISDARLKEFENRSRMLDAIEAESE